MIVLSRQETARTQASPHPHAPKVGGLSVCLASFVLALATGTPRHCVENFLPHADEQLAPYLGV